MSILFVIMKFRIMMFDWFIDPLWVLAASSLLVLEVVTQEAD
jgi:hypothetical protein